MVPTVYPHKKHFLAGNDVELFSTGFKIKNRKVLEWENRLLLTTDESRLESSRFQKLERIKKLLPTVGLGVIVLDIICCVPEKRTQ